MICEKCCKKCETLCYHTTYSVYFTGLWVCEKCFAKEKEVNDDFIVNPDNWKIRSRIVKKE
jgi:protein-arginine kinase activator protein McsA